jgi:hypothetical protein
MMKVRVYWNLHKRCYSVQTRTAQGWRVTAHADELILDNVEPVVSAAGRSRVRAERAKNVHAFLVADEVTFRTDFLTGDCVPDHDDRLTYDPYSDDGFKLDGTGERFGWAYAAHLTTESGRPVVWVAGPSTSEVAA